MSNIYRDVTLNQVSENDIGKTLRVAGWVEISVTMAAYPLLI